MDTKKTSLKKIWKVWIVAMVSSLATTLYLAIKAVVNASRYLEISFNPFGVFIDCWPVLALWTLIAVIATVGVAVPKKKKKKESSSET